MTQSPQLSATSAPNEANQISPKTQSSITFTYYCAFIALGLTVASLGPTLISLAQNTQTEISQISYLFIARALGYMLGSLLGGYLYDRIPGHPIMGCMFILMAIGLALVPTISTLWVLIILILVVGIVDGTADVGGNILLVWLHGDKVGPYMNALHFFFGVGAFLSPIIIAQALQRTADVSWGYWALALLAFPVSFWFFRLPSPRAPQTTETKPTRPAKPDLVIFLVLFFFLIISGEASFGGWIAPYIVASNLGNQAYAAYLTSAFWGALTVGRLLSIPIALMFSLNTILVADAILCSTGILLILLWPQSLVMAWGGTLIFGFGMASLFPSGIALAERAMTASGRITSLFFVGGALGSMSTPWLVGQLFERVGPHSVMWVILTVTLTIFIILRQLFLAQPVSAEKKPY